MGRFYDFDSIGLHVPTILIPKPEIDMQKWAVVACDQFTSQPEYWGKVDALVGNSPSTLHLIFPEAYLDSQDHAAAAQRINANMRRHLDDILIPQKQGFILVDRKTPHAESRKGLVVALDLEMYDHAEGSKTLIRPTECTIPARLPPRARIRENALIELPHAMVLIDDRERTVIEPLFESGLENRLKVYDFELMMNGGHIIGYKVDDEATIRRIAASLSSLAEPLKFRQRYGVDGNVLLYAVGDGNHSLATAKVIWESAKANAQDKQAVMSHPARYALVELVNIHDQGLNFEPIHRIAFNTNPNEMLQQMKVFYERQGSEFSYAIFEAGGKMAEEYGQLGQEGMHAIQFITGNRNGILVIRNPKFNLEVGTLQSFLDYYLESNPNVKIDYIHGEYALTSLAANPANTGFYLPPMKKMDLFRTVVLDGTLPRKAFSMGGAEEKRYYLESRQIRV